MGQFLLSVIDNQANVNDPNHLDGFATPEAAKASREAIDRFNDKLVAEGYFVFANGLDMEAKVVDGRRTAPIRTDGPYVEAKEFVAGLWIINAPDMETALKLAEEGSNACQRKVEVRQFGVGTASDR